MSLLVRPEGARRIVVHRHFNAPPDRVFAALTRADRLRHWLGTPRLRVVKVETDPRVGGCLRVEWHGRDGPLVMTGEYLQVDPPGCLVQTERFTPDWTGGATETTYRLRPEGPGTLLEQDTVYADAAARDRVLALPTPERLERRFLRLESVLAG